jgi:DNA oxidative demethylase
MMRPESAAVAMQLFDQDARGPGRESLGPGAVVLRGLALPQTSVLSAAVDAVAAKAPFRHMVTPGGYRMSVAMPNCGSLGWVSEPKGYRYDALDPTTGRPWPKMPNVIRQLARDAAALAGFEGYEPDACLVNRYEPGSKLSMHQDKDEGDLDAPIVSVSLGVPAVFLFGGARRSDKPVKVPLSHGDVVVWGGPARLRYHGVAALRESWHPFAERHRINLTLRKASPP